MKIRIETDSQEEFEEKREDLLKHLAGDGFEVIKKAKESTVYDLQKPAIAERRSFYVAQNEMMEEMDRIFMRVVKDIKKDIDRILDV